MPEYAIYPSLRNRSVYITGGATGIGAAMVEAFAEQGSKVGFVDMQEQEGAKLADRLGENVVFIPCDLRDVGALRECFGTLKQRIGPAAVLVNNAARDDRHDWRDVTPEYWDERMATNLRHFFFAIQAVAPDMIEMGGGSIINFGSISWMQREGNMPAYTTAKSAVQGLTRTMARDLGSYRIRVNTLVAGWVMTERQKQLWATPEALEKHRERQCLKDFVQPEHMARAALWLASDDSEMCTAQDFMVEAGVI